MKKFSIFTVCAIAVLSSCLTNSCNAHRIYYQDSDLAAPDQKCKCYCNKGKDTGTKGKDVRFNEKGKDVRFSEKGEDSDYHDFGFDKHGKKGKKGFDMRHSEESGKNDHREKAENEQDFKEVKGHKKMQYDESGYDTKEIEMKKGEKGDDANEEGKFKKGHSTKETHHIHKLNDYNHKVVFFDEDYESNFDEDDDELIESHGSKKGEFHKKGHYDKAFENKKSSKKENNKKGRFQQDKSDFKGDKKEESEYAHESKKGKKGRSKKGSKWEHKKEY